MSSLLRAVGVTKPRWTAIGRRLGWLGKDESCGCENREKWLNQFGERVAKWLG